MKIEEGTLRGGGNRSNGLAPYLRSDVYYDGMFADTVKADGKSVGVVVKFADKEAESVFQPKLEEGVAYE